MTISDRSIRPEQVKAIGRIAYRLASAAPVEGYIEPQGQRLRLRMFAHRDLSITLYEAASRQPFEYDLSRLRVSYRSRKVLEIIWSASGTFRVVKFEPEPGDWIERLTALHNRT
jgi:hypothetical protein